MCFSSRRTDDTKLYRKPRYNGLDPVDALPPVEQGVVVVHLGAL